jgi:hypothetical protein
MWSDSRGTRLHPAVLCLLVAVLYGAGVGLQRASRTAFWFDEVASVVIADEGTKGIWTALKGGADANPPAFYLLEALSQRLIVNPHLAYRLPPLVGFLGIPVALFYFVRRRRGNLAGLTAALIPFVTPLFTIYSIEARPYSQVTCCVAWSLVMWQDAHRRARLIAFAFLLAAASSLHYYAVLALAPFGIAELVRTARLHDFRIGVWLALVAGTMPLAAFWPLLSNFRQEYNATFWAQPKLLTAYGELLGVSDRWAAPLVLILVAALLASYVTGRTLPNRSVTTASVIPLEERTLVLGFICLPLIVALPAVLLQSPMAARYVLPTALGISAAAAFAVSDSSRRATLWLLGATVAIIGAQQSDYWRFGEYSNGTPRHSELQLLRKLMARHFPAGSPIVVSNALSYLPMAYYAAADPDAPVYLVDPPAALRAVGSDSTERALLLLAPFAPLRLRTLPEFLSAHSSFLIYAEGGQNGAWDWLPARLAQGGHSVRLLEEDRSAGAIHVLYRVDTGGLARPGVE